MVSDGTVAQTIAHLYPTMIVLMCTIVGWYRPRLGGNLFIGLGAAYIVMGWGNFNWLLALSVIFLPLFVIGLLFLEQGKR